MDSKVLLEMTETSKIRMIRTNNSVDWEGRFYQGVTWPKKN